MQLASIVTLLPNVTLPNNTTLTSSVTSCPASTVPRISKRAGSMTVTPASINCSTWRNWQARSKRASCTRLFAPSTSTGSAHVTVFTGRPSATAKPTQSVK